MQESSFKQSNDFCIFTLVVFVLFWCCRVQVHKFTRVSQVVVLGRNWNHTLENGGDLASMISTNAFTTKRNVPYSFAWVLGGIHENRTSYRGFVYSILVSVNLLRKTGSQADFWVFVRLSPDSGLSALPVHDRQLFEVLNIHVHILPKLNHESFTQLQYDKFQLLRMTNYKRVLYLDADILPLINFDPFFYLSDPEYSSLPTLLKPNFLYATRGEPSNGGMFMLEPVPGAWETLKEVLRKKQEIGKNLPYPHFDRQKGWGHSFIGSGDYWEGVVQRGKKWNFHAAHADQGLLYHFVKYVRNNVSIAIGNRIQNWESKTEQHQEQPISDTHTILKHYMPAPLVFQFSCHLTSPRLSDLWRCSPPYNSMAHFFGNTKPWQNTVQMDQLNTTRVFGRNVAKYLWFRELWELNKIAGIGIDLNSWNSEHLEHMKTSPLGYIPLYKDRVANIYMKDAS